MNIDGLYRHRPIEPTYVSANSKFGNWRGSGVELSAKRWSLEESPKAMSAIGVGNCVSRRDRE
jgi:hypothetical protein